MAVTKKRSKKDANTSHYASLIGLRMYSKSEKFSF